MRIKNRLLSYVALCMLVAASSIAIQHTVMAQQTTDQQNLQQQVVPSSPATNTSLNTAPAGATVSNNGNSQTMNPPVAANTAPSPATEAVDKNVADNPYGLKALWMGGDLVSRITLLIMAVMSVGTWYIIVMKVIEQSRLIRAYKEVTKNQFWQQKNLKQSAERLAQNSPYRLITQNGIDAVDHHKGVLQETLDLYSWVSITLHRTLDHIQSSLQNGLAFLGTVGSTAPFVGLFGTVWGIHHALSAISIAGQATLDKVAGPVGEALIMTAIGLATAVPAVLGYNYLVRCNKIILDQARSFTADVQCVLMGGRPKKSTDDNDLSIKQ
ncbi:Tol-Pal system protein TolQ [Commensalibacter sp. Nvir]|uniref:MotA/TolQ/ExbB proton channel family protein n=1 Tax=Commensalibacter sp. Nvir TaxID=3069817 RepID=UPI002D4B3F13|nr:Tol-Pal system protein TolQ [Commensalibacter sp. Nvir]